MTKVLVTGGAGYIGSVLVPMLLEQDYEVRVVDSFRYNNEISLAAVCHDKDFRVERADVRAWRHAYRWADIIIPLAAIVGAPACDRNPVEASEINHGAITEMMNAISLRSIKVVYPNTNSGYGSHPGVCTEETPLNPKSVYARTKANGETDVLGGDGVSLRFATVFGMSPRMRLDLMVNDFVYRALRDHHVHLFGAHHRRNFIHVRDAARAFIHAIDCYDEMTGQAFNVGCDEANTSKAGLCQQIADVFMPFTWSEDNTKADPDQRDYEVSSAKIRNLGFATEYTLKDGIRELAIGLSVLPHTQLGNV